jgi:hypothetical protein
MNSLRKDFDAVSASLKKLQKAMASIQTSVKELDDIEGEDEVTVEGMTVAEVEANVRMLDAAYAQYAETVAAAGMEPSPQGFYQMVLLPNTAETRRRPRRPLPCGSIPRPTIRLPHGRGQTGEQPAENLQYECGPAQDPHGHSQPGRGPRPVRLDDLCAALGSGGLSGDLSR